MAGAEALHMTPPGAPDQLLSFCKATADSLRLDILRVLRDESFGVLELCHIFDMPQPGMSHHLKILAGASLLGTRREGNSIFYRRSMIPFESPLGVLTASFFDVLDQMPLEKEVARRMHHVHEDRARSSRQFFDKHSDKLKENQRLIAELDQYAGCVTDLLANEQIDAATRALEIGPGESELLNLLAARCAHVVALDNSREMLAKAELTLDAKLADRVKFVLDEPASLVGNHHFDLVVLNMVLHHLASPAQMFRIVKSLLNPEGRLLIIELGPHNQDWAREICGDLWLGFEPSDLDDWAAEAGLTRGQSAYLGLKNGFQVQVRLFHQGAPDQPKIINT